MSAGRFANMKNTCQVCGAAVWRAESRQRSLCMEHYAGLRARQHVIAERLAELDGAELDGAELDGKDGAPK